MHIALQWAGKLLVERGDLIEYIDGRNEEYDAQVRKGYANQQLLSDGVHLQNCIEPELYIIDWAFTLPCRCRQG